MKTIYRTLLLLSMLTAISPSASAQYYRYNYYSADGGYGGYSDGSLIHRLDAQGRAGHTR